MQGMNKVYPFILAVTLITFAGINTVNAQVGLEVNPDTVSLGSSTTASLCAGTTGFTITSVDLVDPGGTTFSTTINAGTTLNPGNCVTWNIPADFPTLGALNSVGTWVLEVNTDPGNQQRTDFTVSLFVIPESIMGAIAVAGASLAVLGGYSVLRGHSRNKA